VGALAEEFWDAQGAVDAPEGRLRVGYWNANTVTVETGGNVRVRPVRTYQDSVVTTNLQTDQDWYKPETSLRQLRNLDAQGIL
jgi:hypothetical protein